MPAKKKAAPTRQPSAPAKAAKSDPLIKTLAEVEEMTDEDRQAFRDAGGTTISNPQ